MRYHLIWDAATKKPAKSMNGIIRIGVKVTANCLSANNVEIINAYEPADAYIKIKIPMLKPFWYRRTKRMK